MLYLNRLFIFVFFTWQISLTAQETTYYGVSAGSGGTQNAHIGYKAGENGGSEGNYNTYIGWKSGALASTNNGYNTFVGNAAGKDNIGSYNTFLGYRSGENSNSSLNSYFGFQCGAETVVGENNCYYGAYAGRNSNGNNLNPIANNCKNNCFFGMSSGYNNVGNGNSFYGYNSGANNTTGEGNCFLGHDAGTSNTNGSGNTFLGNRVGHTSTGSGNIFIGSHAGFYAQGNSNLFIGNGAAMFNNNLSNILYIENSNAVVPLIYGDFSTDQVGINTNCVLSGYALGVKGKIITEEVKVQLTDAGTGCWPDYVFQPSYQLPTLAEVETHIKEKGHLPEVPSSEEIKENGGYELGDMDRILLKKVEELTLYILEQNKELIKQNEKIRQLEKIIHKQ